MTSLPEPLNIFYLKQTKKSLKTKRMLNHFKTHLSDMGVSYFSLRVFLEET